MADYIDRENAQKYLLTYQNDGYSYEPSYFASALEKLPPANVVERPEYEYLKKENLELAIKYDNAMNMVINEQENVTRLRSKIDKAFEEMEGYLTTKPSNKQWIDGINYAIEILERNIGE